MSHVHTGCTQGTGPRIRGLLAVAALAGFLCIACAAEVSAEVFRADGTEDDVLKKVGVDEHLGDKLPLDAGFFDQDGDEVKLGDCIGGKPSILVLNFYECPMLCPITFSKLTDTMNRMESLKLGKDYHVIALSFDPDEKPPLAKEKAAEVYGMIKGQPPDKAVFPFLTGAKDRIAAVTKAVGYRYAKVDQGYAHPSVTVILTPDGRISRYLYGVEREPRDLKLALIEASGGKIGGPTLVTRALLYCYQYDPNSGKYSLVAVNVMKLGGVITLVIIISLLLTLWLMERKVGKES